VRIENVELDAEAYATRSCFDVRPIASSVGSCLTVSVAESDGEGYRLGSPAASIVGIADSLLERVGIEEEIVIRVRAIRQLALEIVHADKSPQFPRRL
jgi:hypothetical protein